MRKLTVSSFVTLDGVIQGPGGPDEDPTGGFVHGGWTVTYFDDVIEAHLGKSLSRQDEFLLGRGTYEILAAHWPRVDDEDPMAAKLNSSRKYVVSTTLTEPTWHNTQVISTDVPAAIAALKASDGPDIEVIGSPGLIQTLLTHDLVDEFAMIIFPLVVGSGKRLFGDGTLGGALKLTDSRISPSGVIMATYGRDGDISTGSFALDEPTADETARRDQLAANTT